MIVSILILWAACGVIAAFVMSRVLSHGRAMARAQRAMKRA